MVIPNHVVSIVGIHDLVAKYTRLVLSFAVSGAIHSVGAYSATRGTFGDMRMFFSQASAIIVEDCVITLGKQVGIKKSSTLFCRNSNKTPAHIRNFRIHDCDWVHLDYCMVQLLLEALDWRNALGGYARNERQ